MKTSLVGLVVILLSPCLAGGQSAGATCEAGDRARALCDVEAVLTNALGRNDVAGVSQVYADEFQLINYRGRRLDKTAVLTAIRSGALHFDSLTNFDLEIRVYGDTGIVTGVQYQVAREPGGDDQAHPQDVRFTHVYVLHDGRWRLVSSQITPILTALPRP
jgi:ketosteroid isomerase-like protein